MRFSEIFLKIIVPHSFFLSKENFRKIGYNMPIFLGSSPPAGGGRAGYVNINLCITFTLYLIERIIKFILDKQRT